jgi:hypothetical protein
MAKSNAVCAPLEQQGTMVNRKARDAKADAIHVAAMKIIEAETAQRQLKTARLRALRLARQAEIGPNVKQPVKTKGSPRGSLARTDG